MEIEVRKKEMYTELFVRNATIYDFKRTTIKIGYPHTTNGNIEP